MFVRPRFLPLSSLSSAAIDTLVVDSDGAGGGRVVPGGKVSSFGLCEARRLRGLGDAAGGGTSEMLDDLGGGGGRAGSLRISAVDMAGEVVVEEVFCRFEGGVSLHSNMSTKIRKIESE